MGRVIIQKPIVKIVQKAKYEFYCDKCGRQLTNEHNPKANYYSIDDGTKYVCRFNENCNPFYRKPISGKWASYTPPVIRGNL